MKAFIGRLTLAAAFDVVDPAATTEPPSSRRPTFDGNFVDITNDVDVVVVDKKQFWSVVVANVVGEYVTSDSN